MPSSQLEAAFAGYGEPTWKEKELLDWSRRDLVKVAQCEVLGYEAKDIPVPPAPKAFDESFRGQGR